MKPFLLFAGSFFCLFFSGARVQLPYVFGSNMVLQQQTNAAIRGWANAGSTVSVTLSWSRTKTTTRTDAAGKWKTTIATPAAGGPYDIVITDGKALTLSNVLIGKIWLCSGQSRYFR